MPFNHEYKQHIRAAFIGCGRHAFQSILPSFQYAPVELVAICDLVPERAQFCARQFGARRWYTDYAEMLEQEELDAVFVVLNHDASGRPRYAPVAIDVLRAGRHVWIEKPPASTLAEIEDMQAARDEAQRFVQVGFKKPFYPAIQHAKHLMAQPEFGAPTSAYVHYAVDLPPAEGRPHSREMMRFLQIGCHPLSILQYLLGAPQTLYLADESRKGSSLGVFTFANGSIGCLHQAAGKGENAPWDRVEVNGEGASLVVENGIDLTYYPPGQPRSPNSFVSDDASAPRRWLPDFSHGRLANKGLFLLGYAPEIIAFAESVLNNTPPTTATLEDAHEVIRMYLGYTQAAGQVITL